MPRQAILYLNHVVNRSLWRAFKRLDQDCCSLSDVYFILNSNSETIDVEGTFPITPSLRASLRHPSRAGNEGWWMDTAPSHTQVIRSGFDQVLLAFRKKRPEYDYYWIVENDVDFSGRWSEVFKAFADNKSDLLCTSMHRYETNPTWDWWKSLTWPDNSKPELIRGFFPFARLSARAADAITVAGQNGVDGFQEVMWPTVLHHQRFVIEDIGGDGPFVRPGNVNRWYTSTLTSQNLAPGTFITRPIRRRPGRQANKLWHPVKHRFVRHILSRLRARMSPSWWTQRRLRPEKSPPS